MDPLLLSLLLSGAGAGCGFALAWAVARRVLVPREQLAELEREMIRSGTEYQTRLDGMEARLARTGGRLKQLEDELARVTEEAIVLRTQARADGEREALQLRTFETLAHRIFEERGKVLGEQSRKGLEDILLPFREGITDFRKAIQEAFGNQSREQLSLRNEIGRIIRVNEKMTAETENLNRVLKGNVRSQGNWGEVILERLLEDSGLRRGEDYIVQGSGLGMRHAGTGQGQRPDIVVRLPGERHLVIDSKLSLVHYEAFFREEDERAAEEYIKRFLASVRTHASGLAGRRYQDADGLGTPDFVLMFMPVEGAYSLAISRDPSLHGEAWEKKVIIVSATTLYATLRTVASLWRLERQNRNTLEIARLGGRLHDKIAAFAGEMEKVGQQLDKAQSSHEAAMRHLSRGRGNILVQASRLGQLGAGTSRSLPVPDGTGDGDDGPEEEPEEGTAGDGTLPLAEGKRAR